VGGKAGDTREAIVHRMADDMLRKLPRDYIPHEVREALHRLGGLLPMNIFLRQEIDRMQKILTMGTFINGVTNSIVNQWGHLASVTTKVVRCQSILSCCFA